MDSKSPVNLMIQVNGTTRSVRIQGRRGTEYLVAGFAVVVREGPDAGRSLKGNLGIVNVGTGADNDLVLSDTTVSRQHVRIQLTEAGVSIQDLGSKNGTWVNGVKLETGLLAEDGHVRLGATLLDITREPRRMVVFSESKTNFCGMLSHSPRMWDVFSFIQQIAKFDIPVSVHGETGTGKELVARALHTSSPRSARPFLVLDCGSVVGSLLSSQLFGNERGAFTGADIARPGIFEMAEGGTVFLDEVGELPLELQAHLLRVLEAREVTRLGAHQAVPVEFRLVSATNRDLRAMVAEGKFRSDLFFRLSTVSVTLPALRDRPEDIVPLAEAVLTACAQRHRITAPALTPDARAALGGHSWPGNIRELRIALEALCVLSEGRPVTGADVRRVLPTSPAPSVPDAAPAAAPKPGNLDNIEKDALLAALTASGWNRSKAALRLGISRSALYAKIQRYGLRQPGVDPDS